MSIRKSFNAERFFEMIISQHIFSTLIMLYMRIQKNDFINYICKVQLYANILQLKKHLNKLRLC